MPDQSGYDLDYRPRSYWVYEDLAQKTLATVKGALRRESAAHFLGVDPTAPIDPVLLDESLSPGEKYSLFSIDRDAASGEFLPDLEPFEVEIARVHYNSTFSDVVSVRAKWLEGKIIYGVLDDFSAKGQAYVTWEPSHSEMPLTMRELIRLMDTASQQPDDDPDGWFTGLVQGPCRYQYYCESFVQGPNFQKTRGFAHASSAFYPELFSWYEEVDAEMCDEFERTAQEVSTRTRDEHKHGLPDEAQLALPGIADEEHG